jgi:hypothetical protein
MLTCFPSQNYQLFVNLKQSIDVIFTNFRSTLRHTCLHRDLNFVCGPNGYLNCTVACMSFEAIKQLSMMLETKYATKILHTFTSILKYIIIIEFKMSQCCLLFTVLYHPACIHTSSVLQSVLLIVKEMRIAIKPRVQIFMNSVL